MVTQRERNKHETLENEKWGISLNTACENTVLFTILGRLVANTKVGEVWF